MAQKIKDERKIISIDIETRAKLRVYKNQNFKSYGAIIKHLLEQDKKLKQLEIQKFYLDYKTALDGGLAEARLSQTRKENI